LYFTIVFTLAGKWLRPFVIYNNNNSNEKKTPACRSDGFMIKLLAQKAKKRV